MWEIVRLAIIIFFCALGGMITVRSKCSFAITLTRFFSSVFFSR